MNHSLLIRSSWLLLLCLISFRDSPGQTVSGSSLPDEQYRQIGRLMAQQNYDQVIAECKVLIERSPEYYNTYIKLVQVSAEAGQLEQTGAWFESLLVRTPPQPMAFVGLGLISEARMDYAGAVDNYQKCLRQLPDADDVAVMLVTDYFRLKKIGDAEAYLKSLIAARADSPSGHHGLGWLYALLGRRSDAIVELDKVLALQPRNVLAHSNKAFTLKGDGRYREAVESLQTCLRLLETNPDEELEKSAFNQLGDVYRRMGNYPEAVKSLEKIVAMARASDDLRNEEVALAQIGSVYYRQNNFVKTEEYWRRALDVSRAIISRKFKTKTYPQRHVGNMGELYDKLGDFAAAEQAYSESLKLSIEVNDEANQSSVLKSLGDLYVEQHKLNQALPIYEQALALGEKLNNRGNQLGALHGLSALHRQMGHHQQAMDYVQRSLKMLEGRSNPLWEGESFNNLGLWHLRFGEIAEARAAFQKTLAIDPSTTAPHIVWEAHSNLATAYVRLGQLDKARDHYQQAIELMESVRARLGGEEEKAGFFQDKIEVYKKQIGLLLDPRLKDARSNAAEAFHYTERARARAFLDLLAEARVNVEQNAAPDLAKRRQELQQRISQLTTQLIKERSQETSKQDQARIGELEKGLGQADAELAAWLRELRSRNPRYAALKYPEPITLAAAQRMLDDKTILLSYSLAEPVSFLFAVSHNDFQVKRLPSEAMLGENVQRLLAAITDKNHPAPDQFRRQSARLSQQLLQPVSHMLAGKKALVIVADGALHRLPFQALLLPGAAAQGDLRRLPYLITRFAISYAPSASVLAELQNEPRESAPKGFIAFGDPVYERRAGGVIASTLRSSGAAGRLNLQPLPYSRSEIAGIAQLFAVDDRELFFGEAASEENVKTPERLSGYRMIHFSTHGYVNETRPRFSGLVLSMPSATNPQSAIPNRQSEDGLLSAYEIFNLKLKADLVVLSACETGLGKEVKGEGLMSLMRAFIYAGTPSVVVSLWNVNDESAADLMIRFYRHLKTGRMSKSEALRQAELDTIRDNGFPFFWAPFVLVGKP
ncbi:MAG: CHAT domain-containing protein [Acidobacteriota bacterium]